MAAPWIPYLMAAIIVFLVLSVAYSYRHRKQIMAEIFPDEDAASKKVKKNARARPNAKSTKFHGHHQQPSDVTHRIIKKQGASRADKARARESSEPEATGISDATLETDGNAITAMTLNGPGTLLICSGKKHTSFLFAIGALDIQMMPLTQKFRLDDGDICGLAALQPASHFNIMFAEKNRKEIISSTISFDEEVKAVATPNDFRKHTFANTVQRICSDAEGKYAIVLSDRMNVRVFDVQGDLLFEQAMKEKKCADMCITSDLSMVAVACGSSVEVFEIAKTPMISFTPVCSLPMNAAVVSLTIAEKTKQLVVATTDGLITVFKSNPKEGKALKFSSSGVRIVKASQSMEYMAIISGKAKLQIVNIETGQLYSQLDNVHAGDVHFVEWSTNGNWLFVASKADPNIETFHFKPQK